MNREVFEKWYEEEHGTEFGQDYRYDDVIEKGFMAGYQAAEPKWTPYKEGDVVEDGWYLVTYKGSSGIAEMTSGVWYFIDANLRLYQHHVTAYRPLPPAFNGDAV